MPHKLHSRDPEINMYTRSPLQNVHDHKSTYKEVIKPLEWPSCTVTYRQMFYLHNYSIFSLCILYTTEGVGCMNLTLSDEPNLGRWRATATMKVSYLLELHCYICTYIWVYFLQLPTAQGKCTFLYSLPQSTCNFKVDEFGKWIHLFVSFHCVCMIHET